MYKFSQTRYDNIAALPDLIQKQGGKRVLLFHGKKSFLTSGAKDKLSFNSDIFVEHYDQIAPNPDLNSIIHANRVFKCFKPDTIIAIGGGSVIDTAKSVLAFSENIVLQDLLNNNFNLSDNKPFFWAVPTTAGSGSESTHFAVLYANGKKHSIANKYLIPDSIILDPELTLSCPENLTLATGMDAICQCIESYWNRNADEKSKQLSIKGLSLLIPTIFKVLKYPKNMELRTNMLSGSNISGKAINITKTTAGHALSYSLTSIFKIPHGLAVLAVMQYLVEKMASKNFGFNILNNIFSEYGSNFLSAFSSFSELTWKHNSLTKYFHFIDQSNIDYYLGKLSSSVNTERLKNHPVELTEDEIRSIYKHILFRHSDNLRRPKFVAYK